MRATIEHIPYDESTKLWTTVCGVVIAAVVDYIAMLLWRHSPPHTGWWIFAFAVGLIAPVSWLISSLRDSDHGRLVVWLSTLLFIVLGQFVVLELHS